MYSVRLRRGARHGETPRIGGNPKNQPISELDIFSKRQALSRAVVVNSNMSRGKYLAWEGPGSRLNETPPTVSRLVHLMHNQCQCICKLASLTAEVAPVKSPKDHVATRGPGTPKVHHGTQHAVQVVVHLRNTQASSRKELPAALRRRSGHESSADWLTATEQRDKNVAAAYSCLFSSIPSFCSVLFCSILLFHPSIFPLLFYRSIPLLYGSILFYRSIGLLFSRPYSLTLTVRAVILFTALLSTRLLRDATVFIFVDRSPCLLQESSSRPRVLLRLSSSRRPTYPRARRRLPIFESIRAACRPRRHISSPTPVRPDYSHRVPRGCCDSSSIPAPIPVCVDR